MKYELLFSSLYKRALKDWPQEIEFGKLSHHITPDGESSYSIEKFLGFPQKIENLYLNKHDEVIMLGLHHRIYDILGCSAKDHLKVRLQDLRPETVQSEFENYLKDRLKSPKEFNWDTTTIQQVKDYFAVNYPDKEKP